MKELFSSRSIKLLLKIIAALFAVFLSVKYLLPCIMPFILAFLTAQLADPTVELISRKLRVKRSFSSFVCMAVFLLSIVGIILLVSIKLYGGALAFIKNLPFYVELVQETLTELYGLVSVYLSRMPDSVQGYIYSFTSGLGELPAKFSASFIAGVSAIMNKAADVLLFTAVYIVASFFISRSLLDIKLFIKRQLPVRFREISERLKKDIAAGVGIWLRAQLMLMGITFLELTFIFLILRIENAVIIAAATAVIDALPVLGTGIVLLPWAFISLITGFTAKAVSLFAAYLVITSVRSFLEPHIVSSGFGVNPVASLLCAYIGFKTVGAAGMILFPLMLMLAKLLNDKGYIKLWR